MKKVARLDLGLTDPSVNSVPLMILQDTGSAEYPDRIRATKEFSSLCPETATLMSVSIYKSVKSQK